MIKAVVFDLDGTLIDTSEYIIQAFEHVLGRYGLSGVDREMIRSRIGKSLEDDYRLLAPAGQHERAMKAHHAFQDENLALIKGFDGVRKVLNGLREADTKTALLTNRGRNIAESLGCAGLNTDLFDCIVDFSMIKNPKPDPEGLHLIADRLEVKTKNLVMVGDSATDIEAGKNAGTAYVFGVTHGIGTREQLEAAGADYVLDSFEQMFEIVNSMIQQS